MFLPSLANIARDLNASYAVVSLAVGGYLAITAVVHLVVGPLSDRYGRRPVMLGALICFIVASIACSLAENIWIFLFCRMLQAGMASGSTLSMVIVRDIHSNREAASVIGYIAMAMALAPMLGPILGGALDAGFVFHILLRGRPWCARGKAVNAALGPGCPQVGDWCVIWGKAQLSKAT